MGHDLLLSRARVAAVSASAEFAGLTASKLAFSLSIALLAAAAVCAIKVARRPGVRPGPWYAYGTACLLGGLAALLLVAGEPIGVDERLALQIGAGGSIALLVGVAVQVRHALQGAPGERLLDSALVVGLMGIAAGFFLVEPGYSHGEPLLTSIVLVDLVALMLALVQVIARPSHGRTAARRIAAGIACAAVADGIASAGAAGFPAPPIEATVLLWTACAAFFIAAAGARVTGGDPLAAQRAQEATGRLPGAGRLFGPLLAVAALPGQWALLTDHRDHIPHAVVGWYALTFLLLLGHSLLRQRLLSRSQERSVAVERSLRSEAVRRSEELEALTHVAATMTQALDEDAVVDEALPLIQLASRARGLALHLHAGTELRLRATAGDWEPAAAASGPLVRLALNARDRQLGTLTLVRPSGDPFTKRELRLLRLLVVQVAIALQNARDYATTLEQSVRDPLTGLYNRRWFFEALDNELARARRYGKVSSIVLLDIDLFKRVNDTYGHAIGDAVLSGVAEAVSTVIRDSDSLARVGGEEFALLLPETDRLRALLVAERVRAAVRRAPLLTDGRVTISCGVGAVPYDASSREELLRRTDDALYWAKQNGRDLCALAGEISEGSARGESADGPMLAQLTSLVAGLDARDPRMRHHAEGVALYATALGEAIGLDPEHLFALRRAALLHDCGIVAIRPELLERAGELDDELDEVRRHATVGASMLEQAGLRQEAIWVRHHHEWWDGSGYPDRLMGREIPLEARIIGVADAFEALTRDRPQAGAMDAIAALDELRTGVGEQFDPELVAAFAAVARRMGPARDASAEPAPGA